MEHGSAHIKKTALQRVYTASNCKRFAGQPIHGGNFIAHQQCSRPRQRSPLSRPAFS
jgi:hypothetical protein